MTEAAAHPIPVVFGNCTGFYHPAVEPRGRAVLMLTAEGYEGLCAHRPWRWLAERLAASGLPVLRFDYPGQGDSGGPEEAVPDLAAWTEAAVEAAAVLRRLSGAREVAVAGLRLGATVAARAAARLEPAPMALLFPVLSGRAHSRELRVQASRGEDGPEILGYPWSDAALGELAKFDTAADLAAAPPRPVLLLARSRALQAAAAAATTLPDARAAAAEGFEDLFAEAHAVVAPEPAFASMLAFLSEAAPRHPAQTPEPPGPAVLMLPGGVTERAVRFGPGDGLVGAFTEPAGGARPGAVALLIPNTGANHHAGNGRLSVAMARMAAAAGMPVLRYDARAHGESDNPDNLPLIRVVMQDAVLEDARAALDFLEAQGHSRTVIAGVCAGGWTALHTAIADRRVIHTVVVNLQRFIWRKGRALTTPGRRQTAAAEKRLQWRALADAWRARVGPLELLRALLPTPVKLAWKRSVVRGIASAGRVLPPVLSRVLGPARVAGWLRTLSARGTGVTFLYSEEDSGLDEMEAHFGGGGRHLGGMPGMRMELVPAADHVFSTRAMRRNLLRQIGAILRDVGGADPAP